MFSALFIVYLVLCLMVAILARKTRLGFYRGFLFSIMITPFLLALYLLIFSTLESDKVRS